jgi:putative transposase
MPRKLRLQYPGAVYHVLNRGDHQKLIFHDDKDRETSLLTKEGGCEKTGSQLCAFCLMSDHFHLAIETPNRGATDYLAQRPSPQA